MNNTMTTIVMVAILIGVVAFFGGMQYQKSRQTNFSGGSRSQGRFGGMQGAKPITGEIIKQDDKSVTVKIQDEGTKIIILSEITSINKATSG